MEWTSTNANRLLAIDHQIGQFQVSPAQYEIIRRVIYETGDFDYLEQLYFSDRALVAGAAALAARSSIVVDVPILQAGISQLTPKTFANPVYAYFGNKRYGMSLLAKRYSEAIFIIGQDSTALDTLINLMEQQKINPALVILTFPKLTNIDDLENHLTKLTMPHICLTGRKGSISVALGIFDGLADLAWQVYQPNHLAS